MCGYQSHTGLLFIMKAAPLIVVFLFLQFSPPHFFRFLFDCDCSATFSFVSLEVKYKYVSMTGKFL